jgi:hypothetical protein
LLFTHKPDDESDLMVEVEDNGIMMKRILIFIFGFLALAFLSTVTPIASQQSKQPNQAEVPYKTLELKLENRLAFKANETTLFYILGKKIIALDRNTWQKKWEFESSETWTPKIEIDETQLYALTRTGYMTAFDSQTGKKAWVIKPFKKVTQVDYKWDEYHDYQYLSFFLFKNHLMISEPKECMLEIQKNGKLIPQIQSGYCRSYAVKSYEDENFYLLGFSWFYDASGKTPNPPSKNLYTEVRTQNHLLDSRFDNNKPDFIGKENFFSPLENYRLDQYFLSVFNQMSFSIYSDVHPYIYVYNLYKFKYSTDLKTKMKRENFGFFYIGSKYSNREWCGANWCDYTQSPRDLTIEYIL